MNEYNFDPMTGEPIRKETPAAQPAETPAAQPAETPAEAPAETPAAQTAEDGFYHYVRPNFGETELPEEDEEEEPVAEEPVQAEPFRPSAKKESKPVTWKGMIPVLAVAVVLSLLLGLAGGFTGALLMQKKVVPTDAVVIYKTTKLKNENGDAVKETLPLTQVAELVKNSVVEITTEQIVTGSFMQQYVSEGAGSGVIISADGYIVTNHHVIDGATNINVRLADGTEYAAKPVGSDAKSDLAVLKVEAVGLTPAAYGSSAELAVGETVVAVGNPLGELGGTVTNGIVSALNRNVVVENTEMTLIQTNASVSPGNSGGGLFNMAGELIGVVNAKSADADAEGLGFAIPVNTAMRVAQDLIENGYVSGRPALGITVMEINNAETAEYYGVTAFGVYIADVTKGSGADKAKLQVGDRIVAINNKEVTQTSDLTDVIAGCEVGDKVTLSIARNGQLLTVEVTLGDRNAAVTSGSGSGRDGTPSQNNPFQIPGFGGNG